MDYKLDYPPNLVIDVTKKCNLACKMCYITGMKKRGLYDIDKYNSFLPYQVFRKII